ncbi:MAG: cell wall-binding repeat-containing protein, partial [Candidatus Subteraquimicrobiales bacterium]|nr:cell wall-binding repeat-containing protein [Candidatus Subteraquimicrobiales bacterium]
NFPDALAASALAYSQRIPILLVQKDAIPLAVSKALTDLSVTRTIILGGSGVISSNVESQFPSPTRIAGIDRYETASLLANYTVLNYGLSWNFSLVATGTNFPDALSGGSLAGKNKAVLLLTSPSTIPYSTYVLLSSNRFGLSKIFISGGPGAISEDTKIGIDYAVIGR